MRLPRIAIAALAFLACLAFFPATTGVAHHLERRLAAADSGSAPAGGPVLLGTTGDVRIALLGATIAPRAGDVLASTSEIETGPAATARLGFADGAKLEIEQSTHAALESPVRLRLSSGTVRLNAAVPHATMQIRTPQALVVFRARTGYVTASAEEDVVTCVRCGQREVTPCEDNNFFVSDRAHCVALADAAVAIVTREHGIRAGSDGETAMVRRVLEQLGARVADGSQARPWWETSRGEGLAMDRSHIAARPGEAVALAVTRRSGRGGNVWAMSVDSRVASVEKQDPRGTCTIRVHERGRGAVVIYDQLGRYAVVPVEVAQVAAR